MNHCLFSKHILTCAVAFLISSQGAVSATTEAEIKAMTRAERAAMTSLQVSGDVSPELFVIIRDEMFKLTSLDLTATTITEIPDYALAGKSVLATLKLPSGLTSIGDGAFMTCPKLASVKIPTGVVSIGNLAFAHSGIKNIAVGANVARIGSNAFVDCKSLASITVDEANSTYCSVNEALFTADKTRLLVHGAASKSALELPAETTVISDYACASSTFMPLVNLPESLTAIGDYAFQNCTSMSGSLAIPTGIQSVGKGAFFGCTAISDTLSLPSVAALGSAGTYAYMSKLSAINLPAETDEIAASAFEQSSAITTIRIDAAQPPRVGEMAFRGVDRFSTFISVPEASVGSYKQAPVWGEFENYQGPMPEYTMFATDGKYRIKYVGTGAANGKYIMFNNSNGAAARLTDSSDEASVWELEFFTVSHSALPYAGEQGSDIRFTDGNNYKHINHQATCWNDSRNGYTNNANRTFAFYMALAEGETPAASPVVAIRGNGTLWDANADGTRVDANAFTAPKPGLSSFVWQLESTEVDAAAELTQAAADPVAFYTLQGVRVIRPERNGVYIAVGTDGKASKIIL